VNLRVAIARLGKQFDRDPTKQHRVAHFIGKTDLLLVNLARLRLTNTILFSLCFPLLQPTMMPNKKVSAFALNTKHKIDSAKVAVGNPQIVCPNSLGKIVQIQPLLSVPIFTGNQVENHVALRIIQGKSKAGKRSGLVAASADETMLSAAKMIAIDDDRTETGNEGGLFAFGHL
jgi:hypothetical protein